MSYRGATLTWNGRLLMSYEKDGTKYAYTYNVDNLRTSKSKYVNNTLVSKETYIWSGDVLVATKKYDCATATSDVIRYLYDSNGESHGFTYNGNTYLYVKNLQGDVIAIISAGDELLCLGLNYDPWGKVAYMTDEEADEYELQVAQEIAAINNIAYRGYFYDSETGLYYLQSRYYDPEVGRFINADDIEMIKPIETPTWYMLFSSYINANIFAYCDNNPFINCDPNGKASKSNDFSSSIASTLTTLMYSSILSPSITIGTDKIKNGYHTRGSIAIDFSKKINISTTGSSQSSSVRISEFILEAYKQNGDEIFDIVTDIAIALFKEKYYYNLNGTAYYPERHFIFSDECISEEIKDHFIGYLYSIDQTKCKNIFGKNIRAHLKIVKLIGWDLKGACVVANINERDVWYNTGEAILYGYRKGIYVPFQKTYRDPYWESGKSRKLTVVKKWKNSVC